MPKSTQQDPHAEREARRYESPIASREHILEILSEQGPLDFRELCSALMLKGHENRDALRKRLRAMQRDGQAFCNRAEAWGVPSKMDLLRGKVQAHRDGFGFLLVDDGDDIYLSERQMRQVFHGDEVLVRLAGKNRRGQDEGKIVEVVNRAMSRIVGRLERESGIDFVVPDNPRIAHDILIDRDVSRETLSGEKPAVGDYVTVEIIDYPTQRTQAVGQVVEVLGAPMAPGLEIELSLRSHDIPHEWPGAVMSEAARFHEEPSERDKQHRVDLREQPFVTIDGEDARDFDDAVYCEKRRGGYRLWVAIADVSHYVGIGSALDEEASRRATSVYFPGRVVPMLPESLSNGLCSLKPEVDRLCMVCELDISAAGEVKNYRFFEGIIHSHGRLTYTQVAEALGLLDKSPRTGLLERIEPLLPHLRALHSLYQILRSRRSERGAIDFETTETRIVFNAESKIETIEPVQRNDAHKLIEECMLCANVAAADFLERHKLAALYRVHQGPREQKLENLRGYLGELGLGLRGGEKPRPADYQQLMTEIEQRADAHLIQTMMLRSLSQAVYQPENEGHFGLAYDAYAHFTSPIRRYPDLLVHRAIRSVIRSRRRSSAVQRVKGAESLSVATSYPYDLPAMLVFGEQCSLAERRADDATRDVVAWLKCEYLHDRVGETFTGVVAGVTGFGLFVELQNIYVEGLVHVTSLDRDYFHFDAAKQRLVGERSGKSYKLGDELQVIVAAVDLDQRKIDLMLADRAKEGSSGKAGGARKKSSKRKKQEKAEGRKQNKKAGHKKTGSKKKSGAATKARVNAASDGKSGKKTDKKKPSTKKPSAKKPSPTTKRRDK